LCLERVTTSHRKHPPFIVSASVAVCPESITLASGATQVKPKQTGYSPQLSSPRRVGKWFISARIHYKIASACNRKPLVSSILD
jgi:hypothetical protein